MDFYKHNERHIVLFLPEKELLFLGNIAISQLQVETIAAKTVAQQAGSAVLDGRACRNDTIGSNPVCHKLNSIHYGLKHSELIVSIIGKSGMF